MPGADTVGGVPVVKVRDYDHHGIDVNSLLRAAPNVEAPFRRSRLEPGDILMSIRGTTGVVTLIPQELKGANITQDSARIRIAAEEASYVYQALQSPSVQRQVRLHTIGQAVRGINIASVRELQIPWPDAAKRKALAVAFGSLDERANLVERLLQRNREYRRGLAQQLLAGKKRFSTFVSSRATQDGVFCELPSDWEVLPIGEIASERSERGELEGSVVYSCTKHNGLVPSLQYFGKQVFSRDLGGYKRLTQGDIAYATNHIDEGSIGLLGRDQNPGLVSPMYTVFRCKQAINPEFLFAVLKTENYRRIFASRMSASVDRRGSLRWKEFAKIRIPVPKLKEQEAILSTLRLLDSQASKLGEQHKLIGQYKRGLMHRTLCSDLSVPT